MNCKNIILELVYSCVLHVYYSSLVIFMFVGVFFHLHIGILIQFIVVYGVELQFIMVDQYHLKLDVRTKEHHVLNSL
jgi:hypothetical protein